jgi:5-methylcytosine-specific restriction endonuclease McrA
MINLLSSPARLSDSGRLAILKRLCRMHGIPDVGEPLPEVEVSELDRLHAVPLFFGLLPIRALQRNSILDPVKPEIRAHLRSIGIGEDEELVDIVKHLADQYFQTEARDSHQWYRRRKWGIADLKASNDRVYRILIGRQNGRCALCGILFDGYCEETLDHLLPWRFVGDIPTGANWQILCVKCNRGKQGWISSIQLSEAFNWVYGKTNCTEVSLDTRFVILAQRRHCEIAGCGRGPRESALLVTATTKTGLPVADHLQVVCEEHRFAFQ